jgi:cobalt-zinc-cadmium efflux system protein
MAHTHTESATSATRLFLTVLLNLLITVVEIIGGIWSGSLSLISDALHNLSDAVAIMISYAAIKLSARPNTERYTFGLKRAEILAAILNSGALIGIGVFLFKEAYSRFVAPEPIAGGLMIGVAGVGLIANMIGTLLLRAGAQHNMNLRSAYLHLFSDAISSVAVILGGVSIYFFHITWIDPLLTVVIAAYIIYESVEIVKEAVNVLLMGAPATMSLQRVQQELEVVPGVQNIHHVHVWRMNDQDIHFEAHVDVADMLVSQCQQISRQIEDKLHDLYEITHVTLQFECNSCELKGLVYNHQQTREEIADV